MKRADIVVSVLAVLAGPGLLIYPWLLVGGPDASPRLLWILGWAVPAVVLPIALAAAGMRGILRTTATFALLSIVPVGFAIATASSFFGPSMTDPSYHIGTLGSILAAVVARYAGTRQGPVASTGLAIAAAAGGAIFGLVGAVVSGSGIATVLSTVIPCAGFECGMGTGVLVYLAVLVLLPIGGAVAALQLVRRPPGAES